MSILATTQPTPLPPMTISDERVEEQPDRALDPVDDDPWINDFIERLNYAIEDIVRR